MTCGLSLSYLCSLLSARKLLSLSLSSWTLMFCFVLFFFFFFLFGAAPAVYGSSQARGRIGATPASLHHSHSNAGSKMCLPPTPQTQQHQILNPMSRARDWSCVPMDTCWACYCWATWELQNTLLFQHLKFTKWLSWKMTTKARMVSTTKETISSSLYRKLEIAL